MSFEGAAIFPRKERVFVARHPRCPNVKFGDDQVSELRDAGYRVHVMDTEPTFGGTEEKFHKQRRSGDVHLTIGGEGTTNRMHRIIRSLPLDERIHTTIGGGRACDIRNMVNPGKRALQILQTGRLCTMRGLAMDVEGVSADFSASYEAIAYGGLGGTGLASHWIESSKRFSNEFTRRTKILRVIEAMAAWGAVGRHPNFLVTMDDKSIMPFLASDFSMFKGDRVAVHGKPHGSMFDTESYTTQFTEAHGMAGALIDMVRMQQGKSPDERQEKPLEFTVQMDEEEAKWPLFVHYDGEVSMIPWHSHIRVGLADDPYYTYSTRAATFAEAA